ncbi:MAG: GNAT family N-acetyltransferase [Cyclobacteriaceae bacterium]
MNFRAATIDDLELLLHWDEQPHVIACDPSGGGDWVPELSKKEDWRELLIAERDDEPIGFLQIIDPKLEDSHYWGDVPPNLRAIDIWIGEAKNLNRGYGTTMMKMAFKRIFSNSDVRGILIDPLASNVNAHRFYERLGFQFLEERFFDADRCFVYELKREVYNNLDWQVSNQT